MLLLLCALGIGGLAHFTEVLVVLVIGILVLAVGVGVIFLLWRSGTRGASGSVFAPDAAPIRNASKPAPRVPAGPSVAALRAIDWYQFEQLIARLLKLEGSEVSRQGGAKADGGVDVVAQKGGVKTVVQCKHWQNWRVKEGTIREMIGTLKLQGADRLSLYTLNSSTGPADQLARNQGIEIITEDEIVTRLRTAGPERFTDLLDPENKHCPICDAPMKLRTGGFKPFWGCTRYPRCRGKIEAS
jgi:Restriction endonuclease/Topoisomerase DNA binding C4 zinc finger